LHQRIALADLCMISEEVRRFRGIGRHHSCVV
jgi:hypothetical protein